MRCYGCLLTLFSAIGALGLVAVKNLAEEGFDVTGFDQNPFVGGLWHYADDDRVSVLPSKKLSPFAYLLSTLQSLMTIQVLSSISQRSVCVLASTHRRA